MNRVSKIILALLVAICAIPALAQENKVLPDRWAGMVLNVNTPDDAIRLLGTPSKDKDKVSLDVPRPLSWLSDRCKEKVFRTLTYKRIQEYSNVRFSFLEGKLVAISMEAPDAELKDEWIDPDDLEGRFGVVFKPSRRKYGSKLPSPSEFQTNAPAELDKDDYDYWYDMIAVSEHSFIVAVADNYKYISGLLESRDAKRRKKINARGTRYPGYVSDIEIVSRTLARASVVPVSEIDLATIGRVAPKGRVQDREYNDLPVVTNLIALGKESVPYLISKLDDETKIESHVFDYWSEVRVGDVALIILTHFFTDSRWQNTTIPGVGWNEFLERGANRDLTGEQVLRNYISKHGRKQIRERWQALWREYQHKLVWDENEKCFKVT